MADTDIEWATKVWNPTRGCRRVSPGCGGAQGEGGCYAERQAYRFSGPGQPYEGLVTLGKNGPHWTGKGRFVAEKLAEPLHWRAPRDGSRHRIFVNSMSDLFFEAFSNEEIAAVFGVMAACPQHDFLILTKRPKRAAEWFKWIAADTEENGGPSPALVCGIQAANCGANVDYLSLGEAWPLPNVWLGVSAEDQDTYDARVPVLAHQCAAEVRFVSLEPMLGPIKLRGTGHIHLDWVIIGGESGPGARPFDLDWARSLVDDCRENAIPCFVKQFGAKAIDSSLRDVNGYGYVHYTGAPTDQRVIEAEKRHDYRVTPHNVTRLLARDRRKGGDMSEWEPSLRVREFPEVRHVR